jgi:hypothetical protein
MQPGTVCALKNAGTAGAQRIIVTNLGGGFGIGRPSGLHGRKTLE